MGRRRRNRRVRFRSRHGVKPHGGSVFRSHKGGYPRQMAFSAHAQRAIRIAKYRAVKAYKAPKAAVYKGIGTRNPYPAKTKVAAYKSAIRKAPAAWAAKKRKLKKYKPATPKNIPGIS